MYTYNCHIVIVHTWNMFIFQSHPKWMYYATYIKIDVSFIHNVP